MSKNINIESNTGVGRFVEEGSGGNCQIMRLTSDGIVDPLFIPRTIQPHLDASKAGESLDKDLKGIDITLPGMSESDTFVLDLMGRPISVYGHQSQPLAGAQGTAISDVLLDFKKPRKAKKGCRSAA